MILIHLLHSRQLRLWCKLYNMSKKEKGGSIEARRLSAGTTALMTKAGASDAQMKKELQKLEDLENSAEKGDQKELISWYCYDWANRYGFPCCNKCRY